MKVQPKSELLKSSVMACIAEISRFTDSCQKRVKWLVSRFNYWLDMQPLGNKTACTRHENNNHITANKAF
jgi:hypothetical protein